jgi:hypothetical protein
LFDVVYFLAAQRIPRDVTAPAHVENGCYAHRREPMESRRIAMRWKNFFASATLPREGVGKE